MSLNFVPGLVSTVIPVFNRPEMIVEAVDSVLKQTYRPIEIIIVDDGSTDGTPDILDKLSSTNSEIRVFRHENSGPGSSREVGRLNAKGEFVQYLDSDDLLLKNKFADQVLELQKYPEAAACYGMTATQRFNSDEVNWTPLKGTGSNEKHMFPRLLRERWWSTSTPLYRRSIVDQAGPWSDSWNEEDWEYEARIASLGGLLCQVTEFVSITRTHDEHLSSSGGIDPVKLRWRAQSRCRIYQSAKKFSDKFPEILTSEDWRFFSDYAFLLGRQCALQNLVSEARALVAISIEAVGSKTWKHRAFLKSVKLLGWRRASKLLANLGK